MGFPSCVFLWCGAPSSTSSLVSVALQHHTITEQTSHRERFSPAEEPAVAPHEAIFQGSRRVILGGDASAQLEREDTACESVFLAMAHQSFGVLEDGPGAGPLGLALSRAPTKALASQRSTTLRTSLSVYHSAAQTSAAAQFLSTDLTGGLLR